jgi:hypothetical protein
MGRGHKTHRQVADSTHAVVTTNTTQMAMQAARWSMVMTSASDERGSSPNRAAIPSGQRTAMTSAGSANATAVHPTIGDAALSRRTLCATSSNSMGMKYGAP